MLVTGLAGPVFAFQVEEASIQSIQAAIQSGETTCQQVVQAYIDRAKAYNGVCTALVTRCTGPACGPSIARAALAFARVLPERSSVFSKAAGTP